jgi:hypothetical protein
MSKAGKQMREIKTMRNHLRIAAFLAALCAVFGTTIPASAAEPSVKPGWRLRIFPYPANFTPGAKSAGERKGPGYALVATNVGGAPTEGEFKLTDVLPSGLVPSPAQAPWGKYGNETANHGELSCEASGQTVTCSTSGALVPGGQVQAFVPLEVEAGAPASVLDQAVVEGGGAEPASATMPTTISAEAEPIGFLDEDAGAFGSATNADGSSASLAGSHPEQLTVGLSLSGVADAQTLYVPGGGVRDISGELPQGMVVNPNAVPQCEETDLENEGVGCPEATQIGTIALTLSFGEEAPGFSFYPLYNMVPPPGYPAEFGFEVIGGVYFHLLGRVRSDGDYGLSADTLNIPSTVGVMGAAVTFWGDPSASSHNWVRGYCYKMDGCPPQEEFHTAAVSMPSSCTSEPIDTFLRIDNWVGEGAEASYESTDGNGNPVGVDGCNSLQFEPTLEARPTTNLADSPSGLNFNLHQPQEEDPQGRSTANLKNTTVTLPAGMALNPSAGSGLDGCAPAQLGSNGAAPADCPDDSKIGSVEVKTPLLENPLPGAVYLAKPFDNPFNSLLGIYIAVEDPQTGVVAKLPGKVTADPNTGQLTTTVEESPELPLEDVSLHLFNGPRAALTTPQTCGAYTTTSDLTPWSTPEGADAHPSDSFETTTSPVGGGCPRNTGEAPNKPAFSAGTISPQAGAYSPFVLKVSREDGSQRIAGIDTTLPEGLTGKLADTPYCPEAAIAQAMARTKNGDGALEKQSPSCPAASEVGTADITAGSGITPLHTGARIYLAGPYKGAPFSVVVITPAVAGPFDLGVVTTRVALYVDPETARVHAVSDPLPQILDGIPLDVRSISLELGKPQFILNPTSCDPMAVGGTATSALGQAQALSSPFQVGGCSALPFKPKLAITLKGGTKRGDFPALSATATAKPGEANIGRVSVELPHSAFLEQSHIGTVCTRVQFAEGSIPGEKCPARSIYGKATLKTPLLEQPLAGLVFLRSSSHQLPDLVVALHGQVNVVVAGKVDSVKGALRNTFEAVPDAPFTKFTLQMQGGKKGLIVNSRNLCASTNKATVQMDGQNGKTWDTNPVVKAKCGGKSKKGHKKHRRH